MLLFYQNQGANKQFKGNDFDVSGLWERRRWCESVK